MSPRLAWTRRSACCVPLTPLLISLVAVLTSSRLLRGELRGSDVALSWLDPADQAEQLDQAEGMASLAGIGGCYSPNCGLEPASSSAVAKARDSGGFEPEVYADDFVGDEGAADSVLLAEADRVDALASKRTTSQQDLTDFIPSSRGLVGHLPCRCLDGYHPLYLGEAHYPDTLSAAACVQSEHCRPHYYHVPVLTRREKQSQPGQASQPAPLVPESLRKHWRFEYKNVAVACECVRPSQHHSHHNGAFRGP